MTAATGSFTNLTVGGSNVALSGHTHSKADITDFTHTHSINDVTNLSASLTGITQTNITKTGTISAATVRGTTASFTNGSFATSLKVGGTSVALVGHSHSAADLSGITFDELTVSSIEVSDLTVNGKRVSLVGHTHSFADLIGGDTIAT